MSTAHGVVVVGAGQAAAHLAMSLRQFGFEGPVTLIGDESVLPYERPPLSKAYLSEEVGDADLLMRPSTFWAQRDVTVRTGEPVAAIDRETHRVVLASGEAVSYDHLVLATGGRARRLPIPGMDASGVFTLRTAGDAADVRKQLSTRAPLVVLGGGYIGLEVAAAAAKAGCAVSVVERASRILERGVSAITAAALTDAHHAHGVQLLVGASVSEIISSDDQVSGVRTSEGRHVAGAAVVVGVGMCPNDQLARAAGLAVDDGVLVDDQLLTSDPRISAIGDVTRFAASSRRLRLESIQNATDQARHVARRLVNGPSTPYAEVPWFWTEQFDLRVQIVGLSDDADEFVSREGPDGFSVFAFRSGVLRAVESINQPRVHLQARKVLSAGVCVTRDQIAAGVDLKTLVPRRETRTTQMEELA